MTPWQGRRVEREPAEVDVEAGAKLFVFERFLRFHLAAHLTVSTVFGAREGTLGWGAASVRAVAVVALFVAVGLPRRWDRHVSVVLALGAGWAVAATFPTTSNHGFYAALLSLASVVLRDEPRRAVEYLRATVLLVTFGAGAQKLLHGTWWRGSFVAWELAHGRFVGTIGRLLSAEELARLSSMREGREGFVLAGKALALVRAVMLGELLLPMLACVPRLRVWAAIGLLGLGLGFGLVADEVLFGGLFVAVVALFFSPSTARALSLATAALYVARACVFVASGGRAW
ncbi:MAG: hypothetical protein H6723_19900 [Sandaracinus sp.]|nr:hypothetical protein [Sandaracinus sp.]